VVFIGLAGAGSQSSVCSSCWQGDRLLVPVNASVLVQVLYACLTSCQARQMKKKTGKVLPFLVYLSSINYLTIVAGTHLANVSICDHKEP
jgi:hypothetical protein